ncbi:SurA N-terminal domain-containing protein [Borrelia sp. RT5S]|uniref:peptidylprolyl isomerase n=1 Tax=Borrelia sp. RT5S TaxID=2898581 RepID=UPI001E3720DC|nr:SurA N-terminal domain-containing protein [Borrelia sp. RT5S]UGQ15759.1 peptidyl-prolyl cis-trans isomerase [Borrelia sp. RT5S]
MHKRVKRMKRDVSGVDSFDSNDKRVGVWGLLALILIVFGFIIAPLIPVLVESTDSSGLRFGSYKGQPIYYEKNNRLAKYVNHYSNLYSRLMQNKNNSDMEYAIWNLAFSKHVEDIAFLDLAKANSFYVSKDMLNKKLMNSPAYLDSTGNFSPKRYDKVSDYQKFKIQSEMVEDLLSSNIQILLNSSLIFANSLPDAIKDMAKVRRNISYLALSYQDFPRDELISYAEGALTLFKSIEVAFIRFKNLGEANDAYEKLSKNTPFDEVAKVYSEDIANFKGVVSSRKYYFDFDLAFERKEDVGLVFSLKVNELSKPIKSKEGGGYEIYKVLSNVHDFDKNSEHDISVARKYVETYEPSVIESFLENKLDGVVIEMGTDGVQKTLRSQKLALKKDIVNLAYNMSIYPSTLGEELSGFKNSKDFYDIIFSLKENSWSKPFLADRKVYVFSLNPRGSYSVESNHVLKEDVIFDNLYQAGSRLVVDSMLNKNDFEENFSEAFFALQNFN